jgi:ATP-dependent RNA helicase DHX29
LIFAGTPLSISSTADLPASRGSENQASVIPTPNSLSTTQPTSTESDHNEVFVSDLDSDLEPDQLIPTYIKVKSKLFELSPDVVDAPVRKQAKKGKGKGPKILDAPKSPAVRKLMSQLQQLESDALFDEQEAEALWPEKRNEIAQMKATQRISAPTLPKEENVGSKQESTKAVAMKQPDPSAADASSDEDSEMLGDMFSAIPDNVTSTDIKDKNETSEKIALRDFGKQTGMSPRRVLEEAVRAR